jgi:hypothetical protein
MSQGYQGVAVVDDDDEGRVDVDNRWERWKGDEEEMIAGGDGLQLLP